MIMKIFNSIDEAIGGTPLIRLNRIEQRLGLEAELYAKLELVNPMGSIKDRAAKFMLDDAEARGLIGEGSVIIEPTSGNTGIGLAAIGSRRGYRVIMVMPDNMSRERIAIIKAYGADVVLTPRALGMKGSIAEAKRLAETFEKSFIPSQFENPANAEAHYRTTAPEIYSDLDGELDIFVAGVGTGATVSGSGRYFKEKNKDIKVVGVEPESSAVINGGEAGAHKLQGIGAGFIPALYDPSVVDEVQTVSDDAAYEYTRILASEEGLLVGISSGAALDASVRLAKRPENRGKRIVMILPDTGLRYLSVEGLF